MKQLAINHLQPNTTPEFAPFLLQNSSEIAHNWALGVRQITTQLSHSDSPAIPTQSLK
jgi:hypothetical protein